MPPITATQSTPLDRVFRRIDFDQLKLPLGFIRLIEAVFCLILFAAFHGWRFDLNIRCPAANNSKIIFDHSYEFHLLDIDQYNVQRCNNTSTFLFDRDFGAGIDMYAYLIPISLFITVGMLLFYLFSYGVYANDDRIPLVDFVVTAVLAVFWMFSTLFFSVSAQRIEEATTAENVNATMTRVNICADIMDCTWTSYAVYGTLTIASLAGVGLFILFTSNIWYIYKETPYFRARQSRRQLHHNNLPAMEPYTLE